ncbi:DUF6954 family protein [Metabacillus idriensis]|uniref:DUF6954 family protein n=1 Tax=Metabacillus idriensis TaxID=324768 RepID=UPI00174C52DA|nr:hypothetical protein [Metabacillus idriensis]
MKWIINGVFLLLFMLLAFFGIGPVLFSDGALDERIVTAFFVIMTASFLGVVYHSFLRNFFK